jgi:hypothetical protein
MRELRARAASAPAAGTKLRSSVHDVRSDVEVRDGWAPGSNPRGSIRSCYWRGIRSAGIPRCRWMNRHCCSRYRRLGCRRCRRHRRDRDHDAADLDGHDHRAHLVRRVHRLCRRHRVDRCAVLHQQLQGQRLRRGVPQERQQAEAADEAAVAAEASLHCARCRPHAAREACDPGAVSESRVDPLAPACRRATRDDCRHDRDHANDGCPDDRDHRHGHVHAVRHCARDAATPTGAVQELHAVRVPVWAQCPRHQKSIATSARRCRPVPPVSAGLRSWFPARWSAEEGRSALSRSRPRARRRRRALRAWRFHPQMAAAPPGCGG